MRLEELRTPNAFSWLPVLSLLLRGNYSRKLGRKISLKRWQPNSTYIIKRQPICSKFQTSSSFFQTKYDMGVKLGPRAKQQILRPWKNPRAVSWTLFMLPYSISGFYRIKSSPETRHNFVFILNPFQPTGPFRFPLKTSETRIWCDMIWVDNL